MRFLRCSNAAVHVVTTITVLALVFLTVITALMPHDIARAAGALSLSEENGRPGDTVQVNGSGLTPNQGVQIYFSSNAASVGGQIGRNVTSYQLVGQAYVGPSGAFANPFSFVVPGVLNTGTSHATVSNGDYYIYLTYSGQNVIQTTADFFVLGPVQVTPDNGKIGDYVNINGTGLSTNTVVNIYFSSQEAPVGGSIGGSVTIYQNVGLAAVDNNGTLGGGVSFQIPSSLTDGKLSQDVHGGNYYFYTTYYLSRTTIATVTRFTIAGGTISLTPDTGPVGSDVQITGQGLRPNQGITAQYDGSTLNIESGDTTTTDSGTFTCTVTVPDSVAGSHTITVSDVTGNAPQALFTVAPAVALSTQSAVALQPLDVTGNGFGPGQVITVKVNGQAVTTDPTTITSNQRGTFQGSFLPGPVGQSAIEISDAMGDKVDASVDVLAPPTPPPAVTLTPATSQANPGNVGMQLTVSGTGFQKNADITVSYGSQPAVASARSDAQGAFQVAFQVPPSPAGDHQVTASDGSDNVSAVFVMEGIAPAPPVPAIPELASGVSPTTHFAWSAVQDPSGVTYTFEVATDSSFSHDVIDKAGLTAPQYTLAPGDQLQLNGTKAPYYWRVRATDGAGNQSDWTAPVMFYVGSSSSPTPTWTIYLLAVLGAVLGISVGVWLYQRSANNKRR